MSIPTIEKSDFQAKLPYRYFLTLLLAFSLYPNILFAEEIRIGMSTALSGPLEDIGKNVRIGIETYFKKINHEGGIKGRKLKLIVKDDRYEPKLAAPNTRELIEKENVLALIGNVGTPTAIVTVPIIQESKTVLFGSVTGASLLRKQSEQQYIFNYRASYYEEAATMIDWIINQGIKPEEIAFFTQKDGYGDAGYRGATAALEEYGFYETNRLAHGRYSRNTLNVEAALATILDAEVEPKVIILAGGYAPSAKFIKLAKKELPNVQFLNLSFVGSLSLLNELGDDAEGVIVTQVVPHFNSNLLIASEYKKYLSLYDSQVTPGFISFEGYIIAKIFVEGLKKIKGDITRESIVNSIYEIKALDIGLGIDINFGKNINQAVHKVWPMRIIDGVFEELYIEKNIRFRIQENINQG